MDYLQYLEVLEFKGKRRAEEKAKESREVNDKSQEDYPWTELCEDVTKLKKLRVLELNKYLNHRGLKQVLKNSKSESDIHACSMTGNARTLTQNNKRVSADSNGMDESDNDECCH